MKQTKVVLDPEFRRESGYIVFESDNRRPHRNWVGRLLPGHKRVNIKIAPRLSLDARHYLKGQGRADDFTYELTYDLPKEWPAADSIEMINRAKPEILARFANTRALEDEFLNSADIKIIEAQAEESRKKRLEEEAKRAERERLYKIVRMTVHEAGISPDEHGSWQVGKSDEHTLSILDVVSEPRLIRQYLAYGDVLALVADNRRRTYARRSNWYPSERTDLYLVGRNESGTAFAHSIYAAGSVAAAIKWIWNGEDVIARNGDVGIAVAKRIPAQAPLTVVRRDVQIIDNHYVRGEVFKNGSHFYARNATLYHRRSQHADVRIDKEWHKIIVARRATRSKSSHD